MVWSVCAFGILLLTAGISVRGLAQDIARRATREVTQATNEGATRTPATTQVETSETEFNSLVSGASAAREQRDSAKAIELYSRAVQLRPAWPDGWWFLGQLHYQRDEYEAAREALTQYLTLVPRASPALAMRGLSEYEIGQYRQSLQDIQQALLLGAANQSRNEHILRYHEALLLTRTSRFEDALRAYEAMVEPGAGGTGAGGQAAGSGAAGSGERGASSAAAAVGQEAPPNPELLTAIGLAGLRKPLLPRELASDQLELFAAAGNAAFLFMKGDAGGAEQAFASLFARFPQAANAHYLYGYLLFLTDPERAVAEFKRELTVKNAGPQENAAALAMLAWAALMEHHPAEALPYARKAALAEPETPLAQLVLGKSLVETGELNGGLAHLEKTLALQPENLEAHLALAKAYSQSGRAEEARRERLVSLQITGAEGTQVAHP